MESTGIIMNRQSKLGESLTRNNLHALVLNPGPSLTYFTGLHFHLSERPVVVFLLVDKPPFIVLPELELGKSHDLNFHITSYPYGEDPGTWMDVFRQAVIEAKLSSARIGVESRGLRFLELQLLEEALPGSQFIPADDVIASLRMYKNEQEVNAMQRAVDIAQVALQATLLYVQVGCTEAEIAAELSIQLMRHGSNPHLPFYPIISGGPNSANPHAAPSDRPLTPGDILVIDFGANVNGYFSDITRTFAIGEVDPECRKVADIVLKSNKAGRGVIRSGITAASVDDAARGVIESSGYGSYFIHRTGHGLGLEVHEEPYIRGDNELVLEAGMAFTIEPGIYLPGRFGIRIEDNVVVTADGIKCLTSLPRQLVQLPLGE